MVALHPRKLTWHLKTDPWKRRSLLETINFRFHVSFWGCKQFFFGNLFGNPERFKGKIPTYILYWVVPFSMSDHQDHYFLSRGM